MRNSAYLVIASVVMGIGLIAQADDQSSNKNRRRHDEFRAECKFIGANGVPVGKGKGALIPHACAVEAKFCRRHRDNDDFNILNDDHDNDFCDDRDDDDDDNNRDRRRARLSISCDGRFLFNERARVDTIGGFDFIAGFPNGNPILKLPRVLRDHDDNDDLNASHDHDRRDRARSVESWLRLGPTVLTGVCAIERRHDHHPNPYPTPTAPATGPEIAPAPGPGPGLK